MDEALARFASTLEAMRKDTGGKGNAKSGDHCCRNFPDTDRLVKEYGTTEGSKDRCQGTERGSLATTKGTDGNTVGQHGGQSRQNTLAEELQADLRQRNLEDRCAEGKCKSGVDDE